MRHLLYIILAITTLGFSDAYAATSVYTHSGNFNGWSDPVDPLASLGPTDGSGAGLTYGSWISYQTDTAFTTVDFTLDFLGNVGNGTIYFYVGNTNGNGWFSNLRAISTTITSGANQITSATLSNFCTSVGGCDTFIIQSFTNNATLSLDSADITGAFTAPNPEPSFWMLLIVGFLLVAARLKQLKKHGHIANSYQLPRALAALAENTTHRKLKSCRITPYTIS
ncbi:MAG: hypothetical protein ACWA5L_03880 [bacterium]